METSIAVFRSKEIRKTIHNNEWWFSVADFVAPTQKAFFALFSPSPYPRLNRKTVSG